MRYFLAIIGTGLDAIVLHRLRSLATVVALVAVLLPYLVGLGLSQGLQHQAEIAVAAGADLYVTGDRFGRSAPVPLRWREEIARIEGVTEVVPRIVGGIVLGKDRESAVLVGIPREKLPAVISCVEGRLYKAGSRHELVVGTELAQRLRLKVGDLIPPFYHSTKGDRIPEVVGIFASDVSIWQARLILTSFPTAADIFNQEGLATDLLVQCRPEYADRIAELIRQRGAEGGLRPKVTSRKDLEALLPAGLLHREGIFNLHFVLAFAVGILVVLVVSGFGLSGRRREIGILKATGWQTDEVLLRGLAESAFLSLIGACVALLLAYAWLRWLNGYGIASLFLAGVGAAPTFRVPFTLTPVPALLAFLLALVVVGSGTLYASWRAAVTPPVEAMR
jgi:ABC-type lipoprotein release transport system permease subunit